MTPEQEAIAEKIIKLHKENDAHLDWNELFYEGDYALFGENVFTRKQHEILNLIKSNLIEYWLIESTETSEDQTRLKKEGFNFKSFENIRKEEAAKQRAERIKTWPQRRWYIIQPATFIFGCAVTWFLKPYIDKREQGLPETNQQQNQVSTKSVLPDTSLLDTNNASYKSFDKAKLNDTGSKGQR